MQTLQREHSYMTAECVAVGQQPHLIDASIIDRVQRLADTPGVVGAFVLYDAVTVAGKCSHPFTTETASHSLHDLSFIFYDAEKLLGSMNSGVYAIVGDYRYVIQRIGGSGSLYSMGVIVEHNKPVCKSLRRLIRQIDRAFMRSISVCGNGQHGINQNQSSCGDL